MSYALTGKTAIVTGAANGVGLAIGRQFLNAGASVVFADMDEDRLRDELGVEAEKEENVRIFAGDLRQKLCQANLLSVALDGFDGIDVLVNASRQVATTDPLDPEDCTLSTLLEQNFYNSLRLSQLVARRMIKQSGDAPIGTIGSIVNLSSIAAVRTHPELLAFSVSTAALDQMTRSLAVALSSKGIRVNAVAFGSVMSASLHDKLTNDGEIQEDIRDHTPLGRIASASEVAEAVQFLASDASGFMTGQVITVDGGRTLLDAVGSPAH
ncbi:MAG: SDR family oxidoreductase [Pseudomonadota bacterium]